MSKLFKLKEWLTLDEAANHLSSVFGEPVTIADIYQLALDNHIMLSVNFINLAEAKKVELIEVADLEYKIVVPSGIKGFPEGKSFRVPINAKYPISREYWLKSIEPELLMIKGLWDLPMIGDEKLTIEHLYQQETSGISIKEEPHKGVFIQRENTYFQLYNSFGNEPEAKAELNDTVDTSSECDSDVYSNLNEVNSFRPKTDHSYPLSTLSMQDAILVVKMKEVTRFIQSFEETPAKVKPLTSKERNSLLVLLGAVLKDNDIDPNQRGITTSLVAMTELIAAPLSDDTIRKILSQIKPAIDLRSK